MTSAAADAHRGIGLGTSSVRVVLLSREGAQLSQTDASFVVHPPRPPGELDTYRFLPPGGRHRDRRTRFRDTLEHLRSTSSSTSLEPV